MQIEMYVENFVDLTNDKREPTPRANVSNVNNATFLSCKVEIIFAFYHGEDCLSIPGIVVL